MPLNRQDILQADDLALELVHVPEWGGDVYVKGMSGAARDEWEAVILNMREDGKRVTMRNIRAILASLTICDEHGNLLFSQKDVEVLGNKSAKALQRVFVVAQRLASVTPDDIAELKDGLEKNPSEDSVSN